MRRIALVMILVTASASHARTWSITPDGSGDAPTIQAGIDSAAVGDTLEMACGTYTEHHIVVKSGLVLRSETGQPECVTIDAQRLDTVILCPAVVDGRIEGLTFTGGGGFPGSGMVVGYPSTVEVVRCDFLDNECATDGGALRCQGATAPVFTDCRFLDNVATSSAEGGGAVSLNTSAATFRRCLFSGNQVPQHLGGAAIIYASSPAFEECTFEGNFASSGSAIFTWYATATFLDCDFEDNFAAQVGAVYACHAEVDLVGCRFTGNTAGYGAAIDARVEADVTLSDCVVRENQAAGAGGGVHASFDATVTVINGEILANTAPTGADGMVEGGAQALVVCAAVDSTQWAGDGTIVFDESDCPAPTAVGEAIEESTWGHIKGRFR